MSRQCGSFCSSTSDMVGIACPIRRIALHPAPDATGVHGNAAFRQKLRDVFVGERISQVSPHAQNDHLAGNWRPLNGLVAVIGMDPYPTRLVPNFAMEPDAASRRAGPLLRVARSGVEVGGLRLLPRAGVIAKITTNPHAQKRPGSFDALRAGKIQALPHRIWCAPSFLRRSPAVSPAGSRYLTYRTVRNRFPHFVLVEISQRNPLNNLVSSERSFRF
jgi:hypothetical protein